MLECNDLINTVTRIDTQNSTEKHLATGFFVSYVNSNSRIYLIVSNKHVMENCTNFEFSVPIINTSNANDVKIFTTKFDSQSIIHDSYDLGVLNISKLIENFSVDGYRLNIKWIEPDDIIDDYNQPF